MMQQMQSMQQQAQMQMQQMGNQMAGMAANIMPGQQQVQPPNIDDKFAIAKHHIVTAKNVRVGPGAKYQYKIHLGTGEYDKKNGKLPTVKVEREKPEEIPCSRKCCNAIKACCFADEKRWDWQSYHIGQDQQSLIEQQGRYQSIDRCTNPYFFCLCLYLTGGLACCCIESCTGVRSNLTTIDGQKVSQARTPYKCCGCLCCKCLRYEIVEDDGFFSMNGCKCYKAKCLSCLAIATGACICGALECKPCNKLELDLDLKTKGQTMKVTRITDRSRKCCLCYSCTKTKYRYDFQYPPGLTPREKMSIINGVMLFDRVY